MVCHPDVMMLGGIVGSVRSGIGLVLSRGNSMMRVGARPIATARPANIPSTTTGITHEISTPPTSAASQSSTTAANSCRNRRT